MMTKHDEPVKKQTNESADDPPEILPAGGSGGQERLREAEHKEGRAPARKGAEPTREE
jgi:hypothetical protein